MKVLFKLLEDLREPPRRLSTSGNSVANGFRLSIRHRKLGGYKKNVRTRKKLDDVSNGRFLGAMATALVSSFMSLLYLFPEQNFFFPIGHLLATVGLTLIVMGGPLNRLTFKGDFRRWHACEHKAIMILRIGQAGTEPELRGTDPVSIYCGSVFGFLMSTSLIFAGFMFMGYLDTWILSGSLCSSCGIATIFNLCGDFKSKRLARVLAVPAFPLLLLAMTYERTFLLQEPTDKQYRKTARFIQWLYRKYPWTKHPRLRKSKNRLGE